ncbi:DUF5057 domain-containing protein [Exiguobacterium sp. TNDT2]|uniref:DUF5057 domain-containing protein n=1 Tax=Exiguobacterium sp. TNDT2 TaxID=2233531 RepID=UPI000DEF4E49|nr:DUF5057 domain-containing protein [Exiguobacterium sp. TNDT2]
MRRIIHSIIVLVLLFSFIPQSSQAEETTTPKYKVLFIRDAFSTKNITTETDLNKAIDEYAKSVFGSGGVPSKLSIDFMTVKQLNAMRFPMDGAYDAIVFGSSPLSVNQKYQLKLADINKIHLKDKAGRALEHNTTSYFNDLTNLKFKEIEDYYVKVGLPVLLHADVTSGGTNVSRLANFKEYSNVQIMPSEQEIATALKAQTSVRPLLKTVSVTYDGKAMVNNTVEILNNIRKPFQFNYEFEKPPLASTIVELYIDFNHNDRFEIGNETNKNTSEKVSEQIASNKNSLEFALSQPTFTGPKNWMVVAKDTVTGRTDYKKGTFMYIDKKVEANILQLTAKDGTTGELSSVLSKDELDSTHYKFTLHNGTTNQFIKGNFDTGLKDNIYDMLIFGFQDSYNVHGSMDIASTSKVKKFAETGQGVMLTHDMIFRSGGGTSPTSNWERQFIDAGSISNNVSGQKYYTNMGQNAPEETQIADKVQDGILTSYPYLLNDAPKNIAKTHNQYFTLDLNDPDVTPWYNLSSDKTSPNRSYGDANNHYYMYTKNNFTYSGAGHTDFQKNLPNKEDEKKILINTMYRAFIGANHKPYNVLESVSDQIDSFDQNAIKNGTAKVSSGQDVKILWRPGDYDFQDKTLTSIVTYNGKSVTYSNVRNFEMQELVIPKELVIANKPIDVTIMTTDKRGASVTDRFTINVKKAADTTKLVNVSRSVDSSTISLYETGKITYTIQYPKMFDPLATQKDEKFLRINSADFKEVLPAEFEIVSIQTPDGNVIEPKDRQIIDMTFNPNLYYQFKNEENILIGDQTTFKFEVMVRAKQPTASLVKFAKENNELISTIESPIESTDQLNPNAAWQQETSISSRFADLLLSVGPPFAHTASIPNVTLQVGAQQVVVPVIRDKKGDVFSNPKWNSLKWEIVDSEGVATISSSGTNAIIRGEKSGLKTIRLTVNPGDNQAIIIAESTLRIVSPAESISVADQTLYVGQKATVKPIVLPATAQFETVKVETMSGESVTYTMTENGIELVGLKPGSTKLKVTVVPGNIFNGLNVFVPTTTFEVKVMSPTLTQSPTQLDLWAWNTDALNADRTSKRINEEALISVTISPAVAEAYRLANSLPSAITVNQTTNGFILRANEGYGTDGVVTPINLQSTFVNDLLKDVRSNSTIVRVNEYPARLIANDMTIDLGRTTATSTPSLDFWPMTSTWRDYRMEVISGSAYVKVDSSGKNLIPLKPGVAKVDVFTTIPAGKPFDAVKDTFYVRVIQTNESGQDDDRY